MWTNRIAQVLQAGVGLANLAPGVAVLSPSRVESLYGVTISDPDTELLLRHRAAILSLVGGGLVTGAFVPTLRPAAQIAAALSMGSYVVLAAAIRGTNPKLKRVVRVDVGAMAALAAAVALDQRWGTRIK